MKKIKEYITERLILSKTKKSNDSMNSITLETFVRWCETSMYDIDRNKLTDETTFDKNDIYDNLECDTARQSGIISKDDYFDFYETYKNDYLENLVQIEGKEKVYITFEVGGIKFYIHVFGSFSNDMKKLFDINIKEKEN